MTSDFHSFASQFYRRETVLLLNDMFGVSEEESLHDIEKHFTWLHVARDEVLFRPGDPSKDLFIVIAGRFIEASDESAGKEMVVNRIVPGGTIGESCIFSDEPRNTYVFADRNSTILQLSRDSFHNLEIEYPRINAWLARELSARLGKTVHQQRHDELGVNIAIIPAGSGAPVEDFSRNLLERLKKFSSCFVITSETVNASLGIGEAAQAEKGSSGDTHVKAWLDQQEQGHRYMVYVADPTFTNWSLRCIQQADHIVVLAAASDPPALNEEEEEVFRRDASGHARFRKTLVLLHPSDTARPRGTARWLAQRQVDRHFHLRAGDREDMDRFARYLTQRELGLVLSGGGSRGFAHFGVLKAMQDFSLSADFIAGVSMGSLIAALYARGDDLHAKAAALKNFLKGLFGDYTVPVVSLARGGRFDRCLRTLLGEVDIEDLWLPYFCVSSNMTDAQPVVHGSGSLWKAVRASSSLPGLVPPVVVEGDLLYDGGLLNNLPVDIMRREIGASELIAVDVVPPIDQHVQARMGALPTDFRSLLRRMKPLRGRERLPNIVDILQRSATLGSVHLRQRVIEESHVDLYLRPPVEDFRILDFGVVDKVFEAGEVYTEFMLGAWMESSRRKLV